MTSIQETFFLFTGRSSENSTEQKFYLVHHTNYNGGIDCLREKYPGLYLISCCCYQAGQLKILWEWNKIWNGLAGMDYFCGVWPGTICLGCQTLFRYSISSIPRSRSVSL